MGLRPFFLPLFTEVPRETVWKIAKGVSAVLLAAKEMADRDSFDPSWPLSELRFGTHPDFPNSFSETVRKGVRVALRLQIWCVYGGRNRSKRAFGRPVGLRCGPLRDFSDSLSTTLGEHPQKIVYLRDAPTSVTGVWCP
jgi:hypothetical protein